MEGLQNWIDDVIHNRAMPRQVRRDAYVVGKDLAQVASLAEKPRGIAVVNAADFIRATGHQPQVLAFPPPPPAEL